MSTSRPFRSASRNVGVPEDLRDPPHPASHHLLQCGREGPAAGGVRDVVTPLCQLGHQRDRDHALARAGPPVTSTASLASARLACSTARSTTW